MSLQFPSLVRTPCFKPGFKTMHNCLIVKAWPLLQPQTTCASPSVVHDPNKQNKTNVQHKCCSLSKQKISSIKGLKYSLAMKLKPLFLAYMISLTEFRGLTTVLLSPPKVFLLVFSQLDNCSEAQCFVRQDTLWRTNQGFRDKCQDML